MPLILPNTIANEQDADGDKLQQNFATLQDWANQNAISSDGSTAMIAPLLLPGAPTQPNQAATKSYVDTSVPVGVMQMFLGDTAPTNWMLCQGQAISRATYAALYAVIGTTYGAGDSSTTFNLPTMQGRSPVGYWSGGVWATTLGALIGSADSTLPVHNHGDDHAHSGTTVGMDRSVTHHHTNPAIEGQSGGSFGADLVWDQSVSPSGHALWNSGETNTDHLHAFNTNFKSQQGYGAVTGNAGSAPTNTNISPGVVVNFIVKVL